MSDEGSSHTGSRKRRRIREPIRYSGPENFPMPETPIIPVDQRVLRDHTLLDFELGTNELLRRDKFCGMQLYKHRTFNWEMLEAMGERQRMEEFLGPRWLDALRCNNPQYAELTTEFHSTFRYDMDQYIEPYTLSFSLGRHRCVWDVAQFARAVGFYAEGELFHSALRGPCKKKTDYRTEYVLESELALFWNTIADSVWSGEAIESSIRDPFLRYVHRILACTLLARKSGQDKVNIMDLFCLYCLVLKKEANLGTILLSQFAKGRRQGAELELGTYVTRIAMATDVFARYPEVHLTEGPATEPFEIENLKLTGVVELDDPIRWKPVKMSPQVLPPGGTPAAEAMQAGHSTRRQVIVPRLERPRPQHPLRPPRPDPLTLETVYDRMMDMFGMQSNMMRYMLEQQQVPIPDWFPPH